MKRVDAKKRAIAHQYSQMIARRQRIKHDLYEVRTVVRHTASKPSTLATAGLCGALVGYLVNTEQSVSSKGKQQHDCSTVNTSVLSAVIHFATLI